MGWTGLPVESGENEKGRFTKFADGTLIQYGKAGPLALAPNANHYELIHLPLRFIDALYSVQAVCHEFGIVGGAVFTTYESFARYEDAFTVRFSYAHDADLPVGCMFTAVGRWKE